MKIVTYLFMLVSLSTAQVSSTSDSIVSNDTISSSTDTTDTPDTVTLFESEAKTDTPAFDAEVQFIDLKRSFDSLLTMKNSLQSSISVLEDKTSKIQKKHSKLLKISGLSQVLLGATALAFTIIEANWVDKIPYETSSTYTSTKPSTKGQKYTVTDQHIQEIHHEWTFISTCLAAISGSLVLSGSICLTF